MAAVASVPLGEYVPTADQRVVLHGVSWAKYEDQLAIRGDRSAPRISFLDGSMELTSPSKDHERIKSYIGKETPDLVIEVVWTSGGIDKLEAYRRLGVREVWFWKKDMIQIYVLESDAYRATNASACLVGLDLPLLQSMLDQPTAMQAVRAFRAALGSAR